MRRFVCLVILCPLLLPLNAFAQEVERLKEAVVTANSCLSRESDRIVYDVTADSTAAAMSMSAVIQKIPSLVAAGADGKLEYDGAPIVKILVDDKHNFLINSDRQYPMRFIQGSYMRKIELLFPGTPENPEKNPVLKITLDAPLPYGAAAKISGAGNTYPEAESSVDACGNTPILTAGANYDFSYRNSPRLSSSVEKSLENGNSSSSTYNETSESLAHKLSVDVGRSFLNDKISVGLLCKTTRNDAVRETTSESYTQSESDSYEKYRYSRNRSVSPFRFNASSFLSARWDRRLNHRMMLNYSYNESYTSSSQYIMTTEYVSTLRNIRGGTGSKIHSVNASWAIHPKGEKKRWSFNSDAGFVSRDYSYSQVFSSPSGVLGTYMPSTGLEHIQRLAFCRLHGFAKVIDNLSLTASLRVEYLDNESKGIAEDGTKHSSYFNFLPDMNLYYNAGIHVFSVGYYPTVRRPDVNQLSSLVDESVSGILTKGNPQLSGQYSHNLKAGYGLRPSTSAVKSFSLEYYYTRTDNGIESVVSVDETSGSSSVYYDNVDKSDRHTLTSSLSFRIIKNLDLSISASIGYNTYRFRADVSNAYLTYGGSASLSYRIAGWSMSSRFVLNNYQNSAQTTSVRLYPLMDFSLSKFFNKINLGFSLDCNDLLHGHDAIRTDIAGQGFTQTKLAQVAGRRFSVRFYWSIGHFRKRNVDVPAAYDL